MIALAYWTTNVSGLVRDAEPEEAETVIVYVPAGVPPVTGGVVPLLPQPNCNAINAATVMIPKHANHRRRPARPNNAMPPTGSQSA